MAENENNEFEFNLEDYNGFYYTNNRQLRKMDDSTVMAKIIERYPDFVSSKDENLLRQVFMVIASNTRFIKEIITEFDITVNDLFGIIFRTYPFIFNSCYLTKIQKIVTNRAYAKQNVRRGPAGKRGGQQRTRSR